MPFARGVRRKEQGVGCSNLKRFAAGRREAADPSTDVHDLGVGQRTREAPGPAFPDTALVVAGARQFDVDAAQAAGRLAVRTRRRTLVLEAGDGGRLA